MMNYNNFPPKGKIDSNAGIIRTQYFVFPLEDTAMQFVLGCMAMW